MAKAAVTNKTPTELTKFMAEICDIGLNCERGVSACDGSCSIMAAMRLMALFASMEATAKACLDMAREEYAMEGTQADFHFLERTYESAKYETDLALTDARIRFCLKCPKSRECVGRSDRCALINAINDKRDWILQKLYRDRRREAKRNF